MEILHRMRQPGAGWRGGLRRALTGLAFLALLVALPACNAVEENPHPPDPMLQDSLGLGPDDRVLRIVLVARGGREYAEPAEVALEPGGYVEFFTRDRRVRTVAFAMDSLAAEQSVFLRETGQDQSPPLVELASRFVVSFGGAPPGRYPFVVEGNDGAAWGAVVVHGPP